MRFLLVKCNLKNRKHNVSSLPPIDYYNGSTSDKTSCSFVNRCALNTNTALKETHTCRYAWCSLFEMSCFSLNMLCVTFLVKLDKMYQHRWTLYFMCFYKNYEPHKITGRCCMCFERVSISWDTFDILRVLLIY